MKILVLILFLGLISGCDSLSAKTRPYNYDFANDADFGSQTYKIMVESCIKVANCHPGTLSSRCYADNLNLSTFGAKLGLSPGLQNLTLKEISDKEIAGEIGVNAPAVDPCVEDIRETECSDPNVVAAYDKMLPVQFANVAGMVPASCASVLIP